MPAASHTQQRGFTLLEALIAVIVLSLGLLGLAQLHTYGLRNSNSAALRVEAVNLAGNILERMRANRNSALAGDYDIAIGTTSSSAGGLAEDDVNEWKQEMDDRLPGGDGAIATNGGIITVTVQWSEAWDDDLTGGVTQVRLRSEP